MMYVILFWVLQQINAPTWMLVVDGLCIAFKLVEFGCNITKKD